MTKEQEPVGMTQSDRMGVDASKLSVAVTIIPAKTLHPGDLLVIRCAAHTSPFQRQEMAKLFQKSVPPGVQVVAMDKDTTLEVLHQAAPHNMLTAFAEADVESYRKAVATSRFEPFVEQRARKK